MKFSLTDFSFSDLKQTPPSKRALNIVVGFDCVYKQVRILRLFGLDFPNAVVQEFSYANHFLSEEFLTEFKGIFENISKRCRLPVNWRAISFCPITPWPWTTFPCPS